MVRQHAGMTVISDGHKEVVNIRSADTCSEFSITKTIIIVGMYRCQ